MAKAQKPKKIRRQYVAVVKAPAPISFVAIYSDGEHITEISFGKRVNSPATLTPLLRKASQQIKEYFEGSRTQFELPLLADGTSFQKRVWEELQTISFGELATYRSLAERLGKPGAARAVGNALGKNPLPLLIPCHRVVAASGLGGFTGGLPVKRFLLSQEGSLAG